MPPPSSSSESSPLPEPLPALLAAFISKLEPWQSDSALQRARLEAIWLKDELAYGRLRLPFRRTDELYLCYAVAEGLLEAHPDIQALAESIVDAVMD